MGRENSIWLGNHRYEVDWLLGWVFTQRLGLAGVRFFFILKDKFINLNYYLGFENSR
jgi:1-acyl-sn-glycerol-3-phosphate acyltransferase